MLYLFFTILGFALGSTLFAYWTPKIIRHIDIRELPADHNPGVANAFMYGGFFCGLLSLILELAKGFVPVFLGQRFLDTHSLLFIPVLIAPVFGHAFPFFRKEKGGKAITASFGVLLGLFPEMRPAVYLAFFFIFFSLIVVVSPHSFRSVVTFGLFAFMRAVYRKSSIHPDWKLSDRCGRDLPAFYQIPRRAAPHTAFQTYSIASRLCCFFLLHTIQLTSTGLHVRPPSQAP